MKILQQLITAFICLVWIINGLFCKILNLVPRHEHIVSAILGEENAPLFTRLIGIGELLIVAWIISRIKPRLCAIFQIALVGVMNLIEFFTVPHLLLFGRMNIIVAAIFMLLIYVNTFYGDENKPLVVIRKQHD